IGAEQALRKMERINQSTSIPLFLPWVEGLQTRLWLAQGNLTHALDWAESTSYRQEALSYSCEIAYLTLAPAFLAQQRYAQALQWLATLLNDAEQVSRVGSMISIMALQVATFQASGATQESHRVLLRLLTLAEPEGYLRVFLDAGMPVQQSLQALLK